jgi:transcriptional regulator with XRE-family HTH domain
MERLKGARKAKGLSLTDVATGAGLHPQAVARAERPDTDPRVSTFAAIAKALGVPPCELLDKHVTHAKHARPRRRA